MDFKPRHLLLFFLMLICLPLSANDLSSGQDSFEFHGYFRGGLGFSETGTTQARFQAPGARAAFRLGNEPDTNLELQLNYNYVVDKTDNSHVQGVFMLDGYKPHSESGDFSADHLAQAYLSFNDFINTTSKLWLGRRYYDRRSIHISDHTWLNPGQNSQNAIGIEALPIGTGKISISLFRYEDNFEITGSDYLINSHNLDLRWYDLKLSQQLDLTLWAALSHRFQHTGLGYPDESGYGVGGWIEGTSGKTKHNSALIVQTGPSIPQGDYNARPVREDQGWNLADANVIEISHTRTYQSLPDYSLQWTMLARQEDKGLSGDSKINWLSTGARPVFYLTTRMNIAVEFGVDYVDDKINKREGSLTKLTTALQLSPRRDFYSRPVLRLFVTLADWSDEFKGLIGHSPGDAPYDNETDGWSMGAQVEAWW